MAIGVLGWMLANCVGGLRGIGDDDSVCDACYLPVGDGLAALSGWMLLLARATGVVLVVASANLCGGGRGSRMV